MSEDTPEVRANGEAMLKEVSRILKPSGRRVCVSLTAAANVGWNVCMTVEVYFLPGNIGGGVARSYCYRKWRRV